jgi:hypothetical protein
MEWPFFRAYFFKIYVPVGTRIALLKLFEQKPAWEMFFW